MPSTFNLQTDWNIKTLAHKEPYRVISSDLFTDVIHIWNCNLNEYFQARFTLFLYKFWFVKFNTEISFTAEDTRFVFIFLSVFPSAKLLRSSESSKIKYKKQKNLIVSPEISDIEYNSDYTTWPMDISKVMGKQIWFDSSVFE